MRHPFDGLIVPEDSIDREMPETTRRNVLRTAVVAGLAGVAGAGASTAGAEDEIEVGVDRPEHGTYVVVPKDFRSLKTADRQKLGVHGSYFRSQKSKDGKTARTGFLAWLTKDAAARVAAHAGVVEVVKVEADDIPGPGPRPKNAQQVAIQLAPNGWKGATEGTFTTTDALVAQWSKDFNGKADVKVTRGKPESMVLVNVGKGTMPDTMVAALKQHPQVIGLFWNGTVTTQALGEEGATTKAVGEEGATTLALGEEGGPSTRRLGEEGGPTTKRLGEEGVTTQALGEEGGPRPRPRPTTLRLGEEGGKPTTEAVGEEGGKPPVRRLPGK